MLLILYQNFHFMNQAIKEFIKIIHEFPLKYYYKINE